MITKLLINWAKIEINIRNFGATIINVNSQLVGFQKVSIRKCFLIKYFQQIGSIGHFRAAWTQVKRTLRSRRTKACLYFKALILTNSLYIYSRQIIKFI